MEQNSKIRFFLGSNTAAGFRSYFEQLLGPNSGYRLFILKGGPGTGKSSLMKKLGQAFAAAGDQVIHIPCASDPDSLDGVLNPTRGIALVDGTAPHTLDPACPGVTEVLLDPGRGLDRRQLLESRDRILDLNRAISLCHSRATALIAAGEAMLAENYRIAAARVDEGAIDAFVHRFFSDLEREDRGRESRRLLSAVSVNRIAFFQDTLSLLAKKHYCIPDPYGAASDLLLRRLRQRALSWGVDTLTCPCSVAKQPRLDHLIFRGLGVAFTKSSRFFAPGPGSVLLPDFMDPLPRCADADGMQELICRAEELFTAAAGAVGEAKELHDALERIYSRAMDFSVMEDFRKLVLEEAELL